MAEHPRPLTRLRSALAASSDPNPNPPLNLQQKCRAACWLMEKAHTSAPQTHKCWHFLHGRSVPAEVQKSGAEFRLYAA